MNLQDSQSQFSLNTMESTGPISVSLPLKRKRNQDKECVNADFSKCVEEVNHMNELIHKKKIELRALEDMHAKRFADLQRACTHKNIVKDTSSYDEHTSWKCIDCRQYM